MQPPFPGMDPFIEACGQWEDFHNKLIGEIERTLAGALPEGYVVRTPERSYVAIGGPMEGFEFRPDLALAAAGNGVSGSAQTPPAASSRSAEPGTVQMEALVRSEHREPYLEIYQVVPRRRLVTGIELLSPSNKRSGTKGWRLYNRKRRAYLSGYANFVEIDLLRGGKRMPMQQPWPNSPYYLLVCRQAEAPLCTVSKCFSLEPLPAISIPLAAADADVSLSIQPLIDAVYARSHYELDIDYDRPITPPLTAEEEAWLKEQLRK